MSLYLINESTGNPKNFKPTLGSIELDATFEENHTYSADVPQHPTEDGFSVADNVQILPFKLKLKGICVAFVMQREGESAIPRTSSFLDEMKEEMILLFKEKTPFTVGTTTGVYQNMIIEELSFPRDKESFMKLIVNVSLTEIITADYNVATKEKINNIDTRAIKTLNGVEQGDIITIETVGGRVEGLNNVIDPALAEIFAGVLG